MSEQPKQYRKYRREVKPEEIKPEPIANGWRSMDTAPKDGTWILVWRPISRRCDMARLDLDYYQNGENSPSHWQPLPEGPTE